MFQVFEIFKCSRFQQLLEIRNLQKSNGERWLHPISFEEGRRDTCHVGQLQGVNNGNPAEDKSIAKMTRLKRPNVEHSKRYVRSCIL